MTKELDATHDSALRSFVASANGQSDFPIQNLPFGIVSDRDGRRFAATAIGDRVLNLEAALDAGLFDGDAGGAVEAMRGGSLNGFVALGATSRRALRRRLSGMLSERSPDRAAVEPLLLDAVAATPQLPARIGDYTDFYVGIHHATNVGKLFRPDNPLLSNYKYVPIGYHGRASSIMPTGMAFRRPNGQTKDPNAAEPTFGPSRRLDYELELGVWIGPGNEPGNAVLISQASDHIAGYSLLNDWSARDIQAWEYQPLGPFLSKNFASTVSAWIVTPEALAPFRTAQAARPASDPEPVPYLWDAADQAEGALDIELEVLIHTPQMKRSGLAPHRLALSHSRHMYWTPAQLVTHHTSGGCSLNPGDLLGSGTISGPERSEAGSLLEATLGGKEPVRLANGEERTFLEDGDEVVLRARCVRHGFASIGFGECRAAVAPAP